MEESLEPLDESTEDSQENDRRAWVDEHHRQVQELLDRAAEILSSIQENRARKEKPC